MRHKAVIVGTGALGLGYLVERMTGDYDFVLADTASMVSRLNRIAAAQGYVVNICHADGIEARRVQGAFQTAVVDTPDGRQRLDAALQEADLVLTATGRRFLDTVVPTIAPALNARAAKVWLLFCENGLDIAKTYRPHFAGHVVTVDTVMSRMCRFADADETRYTPMWPEQPDALVVEAYGYLPLDATLCAGGPFTAAFDLVSHQDFLCWEDVKLFLHNGMHAFVALHAHAEGVSHFPDTPPAIRAAARRVAAEEVVPAIVHAYPQADADRIRRYALELLERFYNPYFNDSIARGVRGLAEKLAPGERLVGGSEFIRRAGIEPRGFQAAIAIARQMLAQGRT